MIRVSSYAILTIVAFLLIFTEGRAQDPTGRDLVDEMTSLMNRENARGVMTQTIQTSSGQLRTFEVESYSSNHGEKTLMRYRNPASVKGQAFLMLNNADDIWTYFPRTGRVRKLASHAKKQKVQGSDFTYEDLGSGDTWKVEYEPNNLGEVKEKEVLYWKLELRGISDKNPAYPRIVILVRQSDYYPLKMDYYNEKGEVIKTLALENIVEIEGVPTAKKMIMKNLEDDGQTVMEVIEMTYEWEPPAGFFSERSLKK